MLSILFNEWANKEAQQKTEIPQVRVGKREKDNEEKREAHREGAKSRRRRREEVISPLTESSRRREASW